MTNDTNPIDDDSRTAAAASDAGRDLAEKAKSEARAVRDAAVSEVETRAEDAKKGLARDVSSVGDALRKATDELRSGSPQERLFATAASSLADMADGIEGQDVGQLLKNVGDFAKRNPAAFLGGAALLGFAGARFLNASRSTPSNDPGTTMASAIGGAGQGHGTTSPSAGTASAANPSLGVSPGQTTPAAPYGGPGNSEV